MKNIMSTISHRKAHKPMLIICILILLLNIATLIANWPSAMMTASTAIAAVSVVIAVLILKIDKLEE